jgi:hypothetical protein
MVADPERESGEAARDESDDGTAGSDLVEPTGAVDVRRRIGLVVAVGAALAALGLAWVLASPVGAAPDDSFHLASIWCAPTAPDDACTNLGDAYAAGKDFVEVPAEIAFPAHCFAFDPFVSAACPGAIEPGTTARALANDGIYPGLYHAVMGLAVGDEPVDSALLARALSWVICVALLAGGWSVLPHRHRSGYLVMLLVTAIPSALSLWTSTNPSGVVVAAISAAWCAVIALIHAGERRERLIAGFLLAVALVAAAGSRADGGVYAFVAVAAACVLLWRRGRETLPAVLGAGAAAGLALAVSVLVLNRRVVGIEELVTPVDEGATSSTGGVLWNNLREIPYFLTANLGTEPIGMLDVPMPRIIWASTLATFFGLGFFGLARLDRAKALSLVCVFGGLLAIPYVLLWRGSDPVGFEVAARYALPLVPILGFTLLYWRRATSVASLTAVQLSTVLVLTVIAHSVALHSSIRRYVTGVDNLSIDLDAGREWWWDIPITPNMVWVLGSLAFAALAGILGWAIRRVPDEPHEQPQSNDPTYA